MKATTFWIITALCGIVFLILLALRIVYIVPEILVEWSGICTVFMAAASAIKTALEEKHE